MDRRPDESFNYLGVENSIDGIPVSLGEETPMIELPREVAKQWVC